MAIMMWVQGRADLGLVGALKALPLALGLGLGAERLVRRLLRPVLDRLEAAALAPTNGGTVCSRWPYGADRPPSVGKFLGTDRGHKSRSHTHTLPSNVAMV